MNWETYLEGFELILNAEKPTAPYDSAEYIDYTKLNYTRLKRWLKTAILSDETKAIIGAINKPQHWTVITEHWCGDAAHIVPILYLMSSLNDNIHFTIQLRDTDSEIDKYLTNGSKAIPILIVRDALHNDLFHWGPRPFNAQELFKTLKEKDASLEEIKEAIQVFYNNDKAEGIQKEVTALLK
ncbi:MAG: thioredoxin family protein [Chitinophagaceae bacterium]|nr:thioredoxin family protein [Chitinophagaceae bacterium]MCW5906010.1 thioredoxin family protein [Chitinophagaceae bacterium]